MTLSKITALSIPALLFACGGANAPTELTENETSGAPRAPQVAPATTPSSTPSSPTPSSSSPIQARQLLQAQLAAADISLDQATDIALAANPGSELLEADLDGSDADLRYEIELRLADGTVVEVHVDAVTGEVIDSFAEDADDDDDDDDDVAVDCTGAISALDAQSVAEAEAGGTAVEVEIDDGCLFEVTVETADGFVEIDVAPDGSVLDVENDDDGPDEADDDDDGPDDDDDDDADDDDADDADD